MDLFWLSLRNKVNQLKDYLKTLGSAAVAFSAGVDSTFLLKTAKEVLKDNVVAYTALSPLIPKRELNEAIDFCKSENIKHKIIDIEIDCIKNNPLDRCYICKKNIFEQFIKIAKANGIINILEGSNLDDESDYRPGAKAIEELKIISPLKMFKFTKEEIRECSRKLNLKTSEKPSFACLASRFVYGEEITLEKLKKVENAEQFLFEKGFNQFRVRIHSNIARIEVNPNDFDNILKNRDEILEKFKNFGFDYTTLDLKGYRLGSMNETIKTETVAK